MVLKINLKIVSILICVYIIIIGLYIWKYYKNKNKLELYSNKTNTTHIPRIIHMTCKDKHNLSDFYEQNYNSWKRYNEKDGWEIRLYDDNDLMEFFEKHYPDVYKNIISTYNKIIYRVDIFKILVLNKIGGVYVDMDVECLKPIDELIQNKNNRIILGYGPYEHNNGQYKGMKLIECAIMMSEPNHLFWNKYVIPSLKPQTQCKGNAVACTGPVFITRNVEKYNKENTNTNANNTGDIKVMEPVYFYPVNNQMKTRVPDNLIKKTQDMLNTHTFPKESYCVHYFDGAWWNKNSKGNQKK